MIAVAWSLVLLVLVANLLVDLYARGAVRDALDDGVRAGAPAAAPADCVRSAGARGRRPGWSAARCCTRGCAATQSGAFVVADGRRLAAVVAPDAGARLAHDASRRGAAGAVT